MIAFSWLLAAALTSNAAMTGRPLTWHGAELLRQNGGVTADVDDAQLPQPPAAKGQAVVEPLIDDALWQRLPAPSPALLAKATAAFPWAKPQAMRELTWAEADRIVGRAADEGRSPLDLFTDPGLRRGTIYVIPGDVLAALARKYEMPSALMIGGKDKDGRPFAMQAIVMGQYHADVLYGRDFKYDNPWFPDYSYIMKGKITETILGDGQIAVDGVKVDAGLFKPVIRKFVKLSATQVRVETSMGARTRPLRAIKRL